MGERTAQPCALTTSVSQTSEKSMLGTILVTRMGRASGTLELRRSVSGEIALCISCPSLRRNALPHPKWAGVSYWNTLPRVRPKPLTQWCPCRMVNWPLRSAFAARYPVADRTAMGLAKASLASGSGQVPCRVMRLKAGPSLACYVLACAPIERVCSKLKSAKNSHPFQLREYSCGEQFATSIQPAKGRDQHDRAILQTDPPEVLQTSFFLAAHWRTWPGLPGMSDLRSGL
jgi:hypothetical protein